MKLTWEKFLIGCTVVVVFRICFVFLFFQSADIDLREIPAGIIFRDLTQLRRGALPYIAEHEENNRNLQDKASLDINKICTYTDDYADREYIIKNYRFYYSTGHYWIGRSVRDSNFFLRLMSTSEHVIRPEVREKLENAATKRALYGTDSFDDLPIFSLEYKFKRDDRVIWIYIK
jgi:hypothetical protein